MFEGIFRGEHLLIILLIVVVLFPGKLAGLGGSLGKSIRDFKKALNEPDAESGKKGEVPSLPEVKDS
jgi:sec-independent protein translocase protein TatA